MLLAASASEIADYALAVFLLAIGLSLGWAFLRLSGTFDRLSSLIRGTERELLPVIHKVGDSVDKVNAEIDKLGVATDSTVEAVEAVDEAVRTVSWAVKRPIQKLAGFSAGISHGFASLRARRGWRSAVDTGKEAAARREADLEEELQRVRE